jgi:hypothetical protein
MLIERSGVSMSELHEITGMSWLAAFSMALAGAVAETGPTAIPSAPCWMKLCIWEICSWPSPLEL